VRRDSGEANSVLIRGLPNVVTLLNGREVFTTSGRYIAFADVPANMLQRVDVYKTSSPDQIEGGIAGAIDVRTRRPFDTKGLQINGNARAVYSDKAKSWDPDLGATISNRWDTSAGEVGALLGLSYQKRNFHEERAFNVRSDDHTGSFSPAHPLPSGITSINGPFVMGYIPISGERERIAANFAFQWRPDADTEMYAEGFVTDYKNLFSLDFFVGLPWLGDGNLQATVFPGTNQLKTLTNHNVFTITSTQANDQHSVTKQFAVGGSKSAGQWKVSTELVYTDSKFDYQNPIMDVGTVVPLVHVDTSANGTAQLNYGGTGYDIKDGRNYDIINWFDNYGTQKGTSLDWRADASWTPSQDGFFKELSFGVRYADRDAESITSYGGAAYPFAAKPTETLSGLDSISEAMATGGPDYVMYQWYTPSRDYLLSNVDVVRKLVRDNWLPYVMNTSGTTATEISLRNDPATGKRRIDPGSFFSDNEVTKAFYLKAKFGGEIGSIPFSGVAGVRGVQTDQTLGGNIGQAVRLAVPYNTINLNAPENFLLTYTPTERKNSNFDVMPSLNLKFDLRSDLVGRIGIGRTITRPDFAQLNPGLSLATITSNTTFKSGSGGNPELSQVTSDNYDATLEWYFAPDGSLTASAFYRNIDGYVEGGSGNEVISGETYIITRPTNSGKDKLYGLEVAYRQFYDFLPGPLSGLGLEANLTMMDGEMENIASNTKTDFRGLSKLSYNVVMLYEKGPWSGRLAYNWREHFLDTPNFENSGFNLIVDDTAQLDGQVSYKLNNNVTLTLEGVNLLDTHFKDYFTDPHLYPRDTRRYDRQVMIGFRWRM
jgi:TonB-dependent receptor